MDLLTSIFSAFGLSASAGLNAYIPLLVVALLARFTNLVHLNSPWNTLENGWIIGLLLVLSLVEFFADKVPAVNHVNDIIQTFIRPVAGAIAFAASAKVISDVHPVVALAAGLLIAGGVHAVKSVAIRPAVTMTTGGTANIPVSILEDVIATVTSVIAAVMPILITALIIILVAIILLFLLRRSSTQRATS